MHCFWERMLISLWMNVEITAFIHLHKQKKIQTFSRYGIKSSSSLYQSPNKSTRNLPPALEYDSGYDDDYLDFDNDFQPMDDDDVLGDDEYPSLEFSDDIMSMDNSVSFLSATQNQDSNQNRSKTKHESIQTIPKDSSFSSNATILSTLSNHKDKILTIPEPILADLNPSQYEAVTSPLNTITRVIAGPGAGKTRVLTSRIAYLLYKEDQENQREDLKDLICSSSNHILAVTFTKKAAGEMQQRLQKLCQDADVDIQKQYTKTDFIEEEKILTQSEDENHIRLGILDKVTVGTFHSICARILRRNGEYISTLIPSSINTGRKDGIFNIDGSFAIIDQSEQLRLIKECLKEKGIRLEDVSGGRTGRAIKPKQILAIIGQLKEMDLTTSLHTYYIDPNQSPPKLPTIKESKIATKIAKELYSSYTEKLYSTNSLDFNDLILFTRSLLMKHPDVRERLHRYWRHILVDEFQDTSTVQLEIVKLLTTESLMVVGDSDQSIYSWRGANGVESMRDVVKAYGEKNDIHDEKESINGRVNTVYLMENYRSTTNIVQAAQKVINADSSNNNDLSSSRNMDASGADVRKNMKPMRGEGPTPRILACSDAKAEASWIVKQIISMTEEIKSSQEEDYPLTTSSTIAIIYRTNAQSRIIEEACVKYNLRYAVRGAAGTFYSRAEIKDCLCFLKWLYNGRDKAAMIRCFKTPSRGIGDVALNEFLMYCEVVEDYETKRNKNISSFLDIFISLSQYEHGKMELPIPPESILSKRALNRFITFSNQMAKIKEQSKTLTVSGLLSFIITSLDLKKHFNTISKTSSEFDDRWSNVMELGQAADRYNDNGPSISKHSPTSSNDEISMPPLGMFLDDVALLTDVDYNTDDENNIKEDGPERAVANLMTIHASKGMEFDAVFLVGNEEGTFPTQRAINEGDGSMELEEERRLCYVAMTRARTYLFLTWRRQVQTFFGQGFQTLEPNRSRFLNALMSSKKKKKKTKTSIEKKKRAHTKVNNVNSNIRKKQEPSRKIRPLSSSVDAKNDRNPTLRKLSNVHVKPKLTSVSSISNKQKKVSWENWNPKPRPKNNQPITNTKRLSVTTINQSPMFNGKTIFPIGCKVKHTIHGTGTVIHSKFASSLRVEFDTGVRVEFPSTGKGLVRY